jgi:hypothetical protein
VILMWRDQSKSLWVLIDSGADESFMDATMVSELGIPTQPLSVPMDSRAPDGCSIGSVTDSDMVQLDQSQCPFRHGFQETTVRTYSSFSSIHPMFLLFWNFLGSKNTTLLLTGPRAPS